VIDVFNRSGGSGKPCYGELTVCWAENQTQAEETAYKLWPISGLNGPLMSELALPAYFEQAATMIDKTAVAKAVICGPDPERHWQAIQEYARAGYDHVFVHQVGPDQEGFFSVLRAQDSAAALMSCLTGAIAITIMLRAEFLVS
jgi:hypothetical protein